MTLEIQMLGDFRIRIGERTIADSDWKLRKAAGIVKLLALEPGHRLHREQVMDTLWPDLDRDAAANNLRYALHTARRILNTDGALARDGAHLLLRQSGDVRVDVGAFETAADAAWNGTDPAAFARAINLYAGDLLPDDLFDEWLEPYRVTLRTTWLALLSRLAKLQEDLQIPQAAITTLQTLVDTDPGHEEATARLMLLLAGNGRRAEALSEYERLETFLARDLDTVPDPVTRQLAEAIRDGKLGQPAPLTASSPKIRTTIPAQTTTFVGRERELAEIRHLLGRSRLVTITGPGGAGKTRMAIHVAGQNDDHFPDGVFFVELAPVTRPELVVPTIIHALGLQEVAGQTPLETLTGYVEARSMLLVLDNIEHVIAAATEVQDILQTCPRVKVLATSRIALRLRGEQVYLLRPLSSDAATTLFIQRSREARFDFAPDEEQMAFIAEICNRLDGLPLAIELAASRSVVLPPQALLQRLDRPLDILTGGQRDLPDRHRSLRDAISWSHEMLGTEERNMFARLAICAGGCSLDAIKALSPEESDVVGLLTALTESSLIEADATHGHEPRFRMLETIREYGLEQLDSDDTARERHARYFATLVGSAPAFLRGPSQAEWLNRLEREHANIQVALDWFARRDVVSGMRMVAVLWRFWWMRGHLSIGHRYSEQFLGLTDDATDRPLLAQVLTAAGIMAEYDESMDWDRAVTLYHRALAIWMELDDPPEGGYWCHLCLGIIAIHTGDLTLAENWFRQALDYANRNNEPYGRGGALQLLGNVAGLQGQVERAKAYFRESLAIARSFDDPWTISMNTNNLGGLLMHAGQLREARELLAEALDIDRRLGHGRDISFGLSALGEIDLYEGYLDSASARFSEALAAGLEAGDVAAMSGARLGLSKVAERDGRIADARQLVSSSLQGYLASGEPREIAAALEQTAKLHAVEGNAEQATTLYAAAAAYREEVGTPPGRLDGDSISETLAHLRTNLGEAVFECAWRAGWDLPADQVWECAGAADR